MLLPPRDYCEQLFYKYKVPEHIRRHCNKVNQVAIFLANRMKEELDIGLIDRLALLHDLMKAVTFKELKKDRFRNADPSDEELVMWKSLKNKYDGKKETEIAYDILKDDYPEFAKVILEEGEFDKPLKEKQRENQIVMYADYRVLAEEVIPLKERIEDLNIRYKELHAQVGQDKWETRKKEISWSAVYYHFRKWSRDGSLEKLWKSSVLTIEGDLNLSELNLDGSHVIAKNGGESVAYQYRKRASARLHTLFTD